MTPPAVCDATPVRAADPAAVDLVLRLALGYLLSRSLHVATELGLAYCLRDGPQSCEQLAARTQTHAASLRRLLRTLAAQGIFSEDASGRFALTPAAALLQRGALRDGVLLCGDVAGDGAWWNAVGALLHSIRTGEPAFHRQHEKGFFDYVATRPECSAWFDRGMANFASTEDPVIAGACDFSRFRHVVDVGGGQGGLLGEILVRHRGVRATLFDRPAVVSQPPGLERPGLAGRWTAVGGDFFAGVPAGGDAYVLKRILHDWDDERCVGILRRCREAMAGSARLFVADAVLPPGNAAHPGKVMDILMMVFGAGRERTEPEFRDLFARAGLRLTAVFGTASALSVLEALPA